jgi:predicted phosphodiesterase
VPTEAVTASAARPVAVAALYDVHGNPAALEAVLAEAGDATLVFGGDLAAGPFPVETLDRIMELDAIVIRGNADRELLSDEIPEGGLIGDWVAEQLEDRHRDFIAGLPETVELEVAGVGRALFCHGSPRSDEEMILRTTPEEWLRDMLQGVEADVVVCGHTHMQFDRVVDGIRIVNAGSVGLAYGASGAHWLLLGPGIEHRRTMYDNHAFADRVAALDWSLAARFAEDNIRNFPSIQETLDFFEEMARKQWAERYPDSK